MIRDPDGMYVGSSNSRNATRRHTFWFRNPAREEIAFPDEEKQNAREGIAFADEEKRNAREEIAFPDEEKQNPSEKVPPGCEPQVSVPFLLDPCATLLRSNGCERVYGQRGWIFSIPFQM